MSDWKPIETAPKDKTSILLYVKSQTTDYKFIIEARYFKGEDPPWLSFYASHPESHILGWMPLPKPPKKKHYCEHPDRKEWNCKTYPGNKFQMSMGSYWITVSYCPFCGEPAEEKHE